MFKTGNLFKKTIIFFDIFSLLTITIKIKIKKTEKKKTNFPKSKTTSPALIKISIPIESESLSTSIRGAVFEISAPFIFLIIEDLTSSPLRRGVIPIARPEKKINALVFFFIFTFICESKNSHLKNLSKKLIKEKNKITGNKSQLKDIIEENVFLKSPKKEIAKKTIKASKITGINFLNFMTQKKVLFSLTYYTPYVSGLTIYVKRIAGKLSEKGANVTILTSQYNKKLHHYSEENKEKEYLNHLNISPHTKKIKIIRVPYLFKISKGFIMPSYIFESYKAVKNSDVVFVNLPQAEGFFVAFWARLFHKKLYCIYHCDLVLPKGLLNFLINKIVNFCNNISLRLADKIIVYTNEYAKTSPHISKFEYKFIQIFPPAYPLSVDEKYFQELQRQYPIPIFKIGFAARIAEEKGLEYLIEAIKNIDNIKLFVAGPKKEVAGEEKYMKKIDFLLEQNKNKIFFLGNLNENQMGAFYKFIDLLVVPSVNRTEAFGLVQAESMFSGKPVVTSSLPGVKFLVEQTGAGEIAKIKNPKDLEEKILKIKNNYKKYQEKTKNIYKIINIEKTIKDYLSLISF